MEYRFIVVFELDGELSEWSVFAEKEENARFIAEKKISDNLGSETLRAMKYKKTIPCPIGLNRKIN